MEVVSVLCIGGQREQIRGRYRSGTSCMLSVCNCVVVGVAVVQRKKSRSINMTKIPRPHFAFDQKQPPPDINQQPYQ